MCWLILNRCDVLSGPPESQKKKQNQDDSDEEDDDDEPGPSFQHPPAAQAPAGYNPAMGQPAPVMPPAGYQGKAPVPEIHLSFQTLVYVQ